MKKDISITMFEVVGSSLCVASGDGQKVYDRLSEALKEGCPVVLSFRNGGKKGQPLMFGMDERKRSGSMIGNKLRQTKKGH